MLQQAGRPRVRDGERGKSGRPTVLRAVAAATTPPLILLLGRARLVESPQGTVEINWPLLLKFFHYLFCVMNYTHFAH
jgi:hypothetical protein